MKMKLGDQVRLKSTPIVDVRMVGKIIRISETPGKVGVMWKLEEGGVLCQTEDMKRLALIEKRKKTCTSKKL